MSKDFTYIGSIDDYSYYHSDKAEQEEKDDFFSDEDLVKLKAIQSGTDIYDVVIVAQYTDDHETCLDLRVNGIEFSALWIAPEFVMEVGNAAKGNLDGKIELAGYIKYCTDSLPDTFVAPEPEDLSDKQMTVRITTVHEETVTGFSSIEKAVEEYRRKWFLSTDGELEVSVVRVQDV